MFLLSLFITSLELSASEDNFSLELRVEGNEVQVICDSALNHYFVLEQADNVYVAFTNEVDIKLGTADPKLTLTHINGFTAVHSLYRVERISYNDAEDRDLDGMDDLFELLHGLNPLDASDALLDADGDGVSNLAEYESSKAAVENNFAHTYNDMYVAGTFNGWNTTANPMQLVGDYTWQCDIAFSSAWNPMFKFASGGNWDTNWGDDNQGDDELPLTGDQVEYFGANILIPGNISGVLRFTFNTANGAYGVELLGNDVDGDGMADDWEQTYGLNPGDPSDANGDLDSDGATNLREYQRGTLPNDPASKNVNLYVNAATGSDQNDALSAAILEDHGPKKTLQATIDAALDGDSIVPAAGAYPEDVVITRSVIFVLNDDVLIGAGS